MSITYVRDDVQTIDILDKVDVAYEKMIQETYKIVLTLVLEGYEADEALREALRRTGW